MDMSELAPGDAKYDDFDEEVVLEVKRPAAVKAESSAGVKADPLIEVELGFACIIEMYFSV
jgi:hypothetical protein